MASFPLNISPWGAIGGLFMPKTIQHFALQKLQLSEKVHHWTPDGPYGSKDLKFLINVPTKLPSFDVGSLTAGIFGKLKMPSQPTSQGAKEWAYMPKEWAYHTIPYMGPGPGPGRRRSTPHRGNRSEGLKKKFANFRGPDP